jgi:hypothetical protein
MKLPRRRPPKLDPDRYPPYVASAEERRRWDLAEGIARGIFGDVDEANIWMATRSIYRGRTPTGPS